MMTMEAWWEEMRRNNAVWRYGGNPLAPHVELRSGLHSDGFVDTLQYLSKVKNLQRASLDLAENIESVIGSGVVDWVFGSPMAGVPIATITGGILGAKRVAFTEKGDDNKGLVCRFEVGPGSRVLLIEEMTTTGGTPQRGIEAIRKRNPDVHIIPMIGAFLIRCEKRLPGLEATLVPVIDLPSIGVKFNEWGPEDCPLCKAGSRAIKNCKRVWWDLLRTMKEPNHQIPLI